MVLVVVACGGDDDVTPLGHDAATSWGPVTYRAVVFPRDTLGELASRIDGELDTRITRPFTDESAFAAARIRFELLDGDEVVDSIELSPAEDAEGCQYAGNAAEIRHEVCGFEHGELRFAAISVVSPSNGCVGDAFCLSRCEQSLCTGGLKCSSSFNSGALRYSRLECVDPGSRLIGETCSYSPRGDGRWIDDCASDTLCVGGTCRRQCFEGVCPTGETCSRVPGHSAEIGACVLTSPAVRTR